jgi:hypothetical protein
MLSLYHVLLRREHRIGRLTLLLVVATIALVLTYGPFTSRVFVLVTSPLWILAVLYHWRPSACAIRAMERWWKLTERPL